MSNCCNRIGHVIASVFQAFGAEQPATATATEAMLTTIQEMWCFLRSTYGDLKRCANSNLEVKYQGLCQGNGAAPLPGAAMSIIILMAHKADGHGATFVCPFTPSKSIDLAILFVDDLDIIHVNMKQRETINEVYAALAASVHSLNNLLMATGDTLHLHPDKCFYYVISYYYDEKKQRWLHEDHSNDCYYYDIEYGTPFLMKHHSVEHPETMLGVATSPSGLQLF